MPSHYTDNPADEQVDPLDLAGEIEALSAPGALFERQTEGRVRCVACAHRCLIAPGRSGVCRVRYNKEGTLQAPRGYVSSLNPDPVEKKPLFHVLPGSLALTFGMLGCNLRCDFCQNWSISQTLRDVNSIAEPRPITAERIVDLARKSGSKLVASSYNEPLISAEWSKEVFSLAKAEGLKTAFISNGFATTEAIDYIRPVLDIFKSDLKAFSDSTYRNLGGRLGPVLDTIRYAHQSDLWVEVVTLIVPGMNDSDGEIRAMARFIADLSPDIPWHLTAFHPDYHHQAAVRTTLARLDQATGIARAEGLRYVYIGNVQDRPEWSNTFCPSCRSLLVDRSGLRSDRRCVLIGSGSCPRCGEAIPGIWA